MVTLVTISHADEVKPSIPPAHPVMQSEPSLLKTQRIMTDKTTKALSLRGQQDDANKQQEVVPEDNMSHIVSIVGQEGFEEYRLLDDLYASGQHSEAINQAEAYLKGHPSDVDVRLVLGKFYFLDKNYSQARDELTVVLQQNPHYIDARLLLINIELSSHHFNQALTIVNSGLMLDAT